MAAPATGRPRRHTQAPGAPSRSAGLAAALLLVLTVAAAVCDAAFPARAKAETLAGSRSTGMVNVPTADTGPAGQFTAGLNAAAGEALHSFVRYQLTDDLELGLTLASGLPDGGGRGAPLGLLARYRILKERGPTPAVAIGVEGDRGYAVASHRLPGPLLRLHVGVRSGDQGLRAFAGLNAMLNPVTVSRPGGIPRPVVTVGIDYDGSVLGAGATLQWGPRLAVTLGVRDRGALQVVAGFSFSSLP